MKRGHMLGNGFTLVAFDFGVREGRVEERRGNPGTNVVYRI